MESVSLVGAKEIKFGVAWETSDTNLDLDSLVLIFDKWGNHVETIDGLSRTVSRCGSINHHGDSVTGGGDGDAETIGINLTTIEKRTEVLVLVINIMRGNFAKVESIRARIVCEIPDGTNLGEKHREEAKELLNRAAKKEKLWNMKVEKERLMQTQRLEDKIRYTEEGMLKEKSYSNKDLSKTIKQMRNQIEVFDNGQDPENEKLARLQAMLEQVQEGEEADMNITWGEFFENMQDQKGVAKAFSHASIFQGSLNGSFGGEEISRLEMIRKRGMHKIYEFFPPVEPDNKSKTMMPSIGDDSANSAVVGYLNLRKELKKRGGLSKSTSEKQLDMALNMAKPSNFLLNNLGPKKTKRVEKWTIRKSKKKSTPFFNLSMESVSLGDPNGYRQENDSVGGSFFITDGDEFLMDEVNHANTLPTISGIDSSVQKRSIVSERKFKGGRYGNSIEEIMKSASKILEESDERIIIKKKKKKRRKLHEQDKKRGINEIKRKPRKKSITRRQSVSTKSKGQWRIRHYQKQEVMEVINSFKKLDDDLTGEIDISEFLQLPQFEGMDKATVDHLFRTIDSDGGGSVTQEELLRVMFPRASESDLKLMEELAHVEQFATVKETKNVLSREQPIGPRNNTNQGCGIYVYNNI